MAVAATHSPDGGIEVKSVAQAGKTLYAAQQRLAAKLENGGREETVGFTIPSSGQRAGRCRQV